MRQPSVGFGVMLQVHAAGEWICHQAGRTVRVNASCCVTHGAHGTEPLRQWCVPRSGPNWPIRCHRAVAGVMDCAGTPAMTVFERPDAECLVR
ncbi:MAG: hypothetical protein ACI9DC_003122 [Gammaproteobacteria bacterium]|jgi:hypothetical protein